MNILDGVKPERLMYYFEEISKIPRCSFQEEKISNYLLGLGKELGLETIQDEALNIIIKKPASKGYENSPTVVLQGHMDMVCEKTDDSDHDFSKDPIDFKIDGDYVIAEETTLGADNGVALAMGLAIIEDKDLSHPAIELLITSNEESGMTGAGELDPANIEGRILINIDSEEEGTALVSCAGGERALVTLPIRWTLLAEELDIYKLQVRGLQGGHSGMEINQERGNSNKIMGRVLERLNREMGINMISIEGGSKSNAIPRLSSAQINFYENKLENIEKIIEDLNREIKNELIDKDKNIEISLEKEEKKTNRVFDTTTKTSIISLLSLIPNGVQSMSGEIQGLVESSNNLGVVRSLVDKITIESAIRSSIGSLKEDISNKIRLLADLTGGDFQTTSSYPAWEYKKDSYIREVFKKTYEDLYNKPLEIDAIHAGLECGLFDEKFDDMDLISFGPDIYGVHAPGEYFSISSVQRSYDLLVRVLENIK